jgi:hypothetical protein
VYGCRGGGGNGREEVGCAVTRTEREDGGGTSTRDVRWHPRRMRDPAFQIWMITDIWLE